MTTINYGKTRINSINDGIKRMLGSMKYTTVYDDFKIRYGYKKMDSYLGWDEQNFIKQLKFFKNSVDSLCDLFDIRFYKIEMEDESYYSVSMNEYEKRNKYINIYLYIDKVKLEELKGNIDNNEKFQGTKVIDTIKHDRDVFKLVHDDDTDILSISLSGNKLIFSYLFTDHEFKDDKNRIHDRDSEYSGIIDQFKDGYHPFKSDKEFITYVTDKVLEWFNEGNCDESYDAEREFYEDYITESSWDELDDDYDDDDNDDTADDEDDDSDDDCDDDDE